MISVPLPVARLHRRSVATGLAVVVVLLTYVAAMAWLLQLPYDIAGGVVVAHVLALITVPIILRLTRNETDRRIRSMIIGGAVLKLVGAVARYGVVFGVYGSGDAVGYDRVGGQVAQAFRQGDFAFEVGQRLTGTGFIEVFTGVVYSLTGTTRLGGFLFYSWMGFWGLYLFYRAFRVAVPHGDARLYAGLIFFLPSMAFWPSSIGKEAWMTLMLGMAAYGTARLVSRVGGGVPWLIIGLVGSGVVRAHITITIVVSLGVAYLLTTSRRGSFGAPFAKMAGMVSLLVVFALVLSTVQDQFKLDEGQGVEAVFERTETQTSQDGSEFEAVAARSPADLPLATFSVLFRPLPYEARNIQTLLASLEGALLLFLFLRHWRRLANLLPRRSTPYLAFVATYSLLFVIAFSNFGNFGILARQRVQLYPFVLVLLAVDRRTIKPTHANAEEPKPRGCPGSRGI